MSNQDILKIRLDHLRSERIKSYQRLYKARENKISKAEINKLESECNELEEAIKETERELWNIGQTQLCKNLSALVSNNWKFVTACGLFVFCVSQITEARFYLGDSPESARIKSAALRANAHSNFLAGAWRAGEDKILVCDERFGQNRQNYLHYHN